MKLKYTKKEIKEFILGILGILLYITILCGATIGVCILFKTEIDGFIISTLEKIPIQFLPEIATEQESFYTYFFKEAIGYIGGYSVIGIICVLVALLKIGFEKISSIFINKK